MEIVKKMTECARSAVMLDGEISKYVEFYKESLRDSRYHQIYSGYIRYSSCRYNERQLIDVTVVRRVRPRAERSCTNE